MKQLSVILLFFLSVATMAQRTRFEATVVDAQTHEMLSFASVYIDRGASTITNAEGTFAIECDSSDVLRISYVGYKTAYVMAGHLRNVVTLEPNETLLQEVLVVPIGPMIDKICKETLRIMRKHSNKKNQFFYRQTAFSDSTCYEFAEAFIQGGSAVSLNNLRLLSGRYAGLQSDSANFYSFFGNFYTFSQLEVAATYSKPAPYNDVVPLFRNYDKYYDVSYEVTSEDSARIFVIHFVPKPKALKEYAILAATLYVDEKTLHLRRIVGEGKNFKVVTMYKKVLFDLAGIPFIRTYRHTHDTEFSYVIDLSDKRGFPEVQSAFVEAVYELEGKNITTRSLLYNIGDDEKKQTKHSILGRVANWFKEQYKPVEYESLGFSSVLHKKIEEQGYDPEFWNKNEIVRRTPIEQEVLELFEQQNLFGLMSTDDESARASAPDRTIIRFRYEEQE